MMSVIQMQFGFMTEEETINVMFILRRLQEELYVCFVDLDKAYERVSGIVLECAFWRKEYQKDFCCHLFFLQ